MSTGNPIEIKIAIPCLVFKHIQDNPETIVNLIGQQQLDFLKSRIVDSLSESDGGPEINDLYVSKFGLENDLGKGVFRMNFTISRRFCCSDVSAATSDYIDFTFEYRNELMIARGSFFQWTLDN